MAKQRLPGQLVLSKYINDSDRYAIRIQKLAGLTHLCNDHQQSTPKFFTNMWPELGKSMILTWRVIFDLLTHQKPF